MVVTDDLDDLDDLDGLIGQLREAGAGFRGDFRSRGGPADPAGGSFRECRGVVRVREKVGEAAALALAAPASRPFPSTPPAWGR